MPGFGSWTAGLAPPELIELWCRLLGEYADLQRSVPVDAVLAAGVPDFRLPRLPQWYKGLLDGHEWVLGAGEV
jgi:hypothetical protein